VTHAEPEVWFSDRAGGWHRVAKTFSQCVVNVLKLKPRLLLDGLFQSCFGFEDGYCI
jgi:hypothetical protein